MTLPSKPKNLDEAWTIITSLVQHINNQEEQIKELTARLNKNSRNSSKPPSSDGLTKPPRQSGIRTLKSSRRPH